MIVSVAITVKLREIAANTIGVIHEVSNFNTACKAFMMLFNVWVYFKCLYWIWGQESCIKYIYLHGNDISTCTSWTLDLIYIHLNQYYANTHIYRSFHPHKANLHLMSYINICFLAWGWSFFLSYCLIEIKSCYPGKDICLCFIWNLKPLTVFE